MTGKSSKKSEVKTDTILNCVADGVFTVDLDWKTTSFNRAAEEITSISKEEAIGRPCCEVFRANICEGECALRQTMETGVNIINKPVYIMTGEGKRVPISVSTALLKDKKGRVVGGVETFRDLTMVEELRKELRRQYTFEEIISKSRRMRQIFSTLPQIAESESTVLIVGESGTGKELIARAIHGLSPRQEGPLVAVNCGALPDTLLESELFGYVAGAFTDARKDKPGKFAIAEGGTIFLDEIGDMSPALQVRLLRVLQEREYIPLGGTRSIKTNVRVIAATNKDIDKITREGTFRQDLYYRINVVKIVLPALKDRREDVPLLVEYFIDRFNRMRGKDIAGISEEAMAVFIQHDWPGNIRELENVIEHASILCRSGLIHIEHLPESLVPADVEDIPPAGTTLAEMEARYILQALKRNHGKKIATARELGIDKTTLWRKIKKYGIA
ncbi:MAG: sigma 54-interacting transcriptional regulator [Desulfobacterales bacterium]|nr:sigma 54-interacting transcriptional regulator [Desulfobacterales bacterium]